MLIKRAYKTQLDPNNKQGTTMGRCCGAQRFVFNWGLAEWEQQYKAGGKPSAYALKKQFNAVKYSDEKLSWILNLPQCVTEAAFVNLGAAFRNFFRRVENGEDEAGYPKFKRRGQQNSFQIKGYKTDSNRAWLGRHIGWVKLKEWGYIPPDVAYRKNGGATYATVSEKAGCWFISVQVEENVSAPVNDSTGVIGVDFGIKSLAVYSDGTVFDNPKPLREAMKRLARLQRELARRARYGSNWYKTKRKIQRCHARIANIREHTLHQISHDLIVNKHPAVVAIEDLNVSGMIKNHHLAQAILDCGFYELRRQIEYKAQWYGVKVVLVDRWYPSSKTCSRCGCIDDDMTLKDRVYKCKHCGLEIDRDYNAALNIAAIGNREAYGDSLGSCGGESRTVNQEPSNC